MHTNIQAVTYSVGTHPKSVAIGDLNKDGCLDIVTANWDSNSVSVLFGNPAGTFAPAPNSPYSVGTNPRSVAIGDLNGDGYLDIVIANTGANSVSILLGNSVGTFAPAPKFSYSVDTSPYAVAIGDLNKDGYLDIATANGANSVSILIGSSDGTFSQSQNSPYVIGKGPISITVGDVNKDGYLDIVTGNYGANSVSVLLGNYAGTFFPSTNSPYSVGTQPYSVAIADLNKDGYLDVVTANHGSNSVSILLGSFDGTFFQSPNSPYTIGTRPYAVAIGDLNKDGYLDIVTGNYGANSVSVLLGNYAGTFFPSTNSPYSVGSGPHSVAIADLNKDGNLDIVTANYDSSLVAVLYGTIDGPFSQSMDKFIAQELKQAIKEQRPDQVDVSIFYSFIIAGALVIGAYKGPVLLEGAAIGVATGTALCLVMHHYSDISYYVTKLIGDAKPEDL